MIDPLVETHALSKSYLAVEGEVPVLANVTCRVDPSDYIALIGPSGSGKSTLLHIMAGLVAPSHGAIAWPAIGQRDQLMPRNLQAVFQAASLFPALTVRDNIALPNLLAGETPAPGLRPEDLLERFGLAELATKLPEELSGGQAQRVAMLRALSPAPRLVLADEPTGQLDSETAQGFLTEVLAIAAEHGIALVIATHDPAIAGRMNRRWSIDHGALWSTPTSAEVNP